MILIRKPEGHFSGSANNQHGAKPATRINVVEHCDLFAGRALTPGAVALMLMLCLSWGFNQIAVKLVLPEVPPMLQALTRSLGALPVLLVIGWFRGVKFFERDGTLWPGVIAGVIFGIEFVLTIAVCC